MLEKVAAQGALQIGERARSVVKRFGERTGARDTDFQAQTRSEEPAEAEEGKIVVRLEAFAAGEEEIQRVIPVAPPQQFAAEIEEGIPCTGVGHGEHFLDDPGRLVAPARSGVGG